MIEAQIQTMDQPGMRPPMDPDNPPVRKLTEQEIQKAQEHEMFMVMEQERADMERFDALDRIGQTLQKRKQTAISHKSPIEQRMLADESQYWGSGYNSPTKDDATGGQAHSRIATPVDNKTRAKTRIAAARIGDMLFPTNAPNWALHPSPEPSVPPEDIAAEYQNEIDAIPPPPPGPDGAPAPPPEPPPFDKQALTDKIAWRACRRMERRIRDALSASEYAKIGRAVIMDACKLGTGVIKGPYQRRILRRRYMSANDDTGARVEMMKVSVETSPAVARTSPWMFFPQPARNIEECEWGFELHMYNKTQLQQMIETHEFIPENVVAVIEHGPTRSSVAGILSARAAITGEHNQFEENWAIWEYHGPLDKNDLNYIGVEIPDDDMAELMSLYGEVWMSDDGTVLRVSLSMLEADSSVPWNVFNYEEDEVSLFGFGIPFIMRDDQFVIDMMWDALTHNAAVSSGPQVVITKGVLVPADGSYRILGPKLWYHGDEDIPVSDAFKAFTVPSNIQENMTLYEQAKTNADENTNLPLLLGDTLGTNTTIPTSGLAMLLNQQNIVQRQAAHSWDDNITSRVISKLYHWYMEHDPDPSIKGDYEVEVRGASYLLVKDAQAQHAQLLIQMAAQDPVLASMINQDELYRLYLNFMDIPVERVLKPVEQVTREQAQQTPPPEQELALKEQQGRIDKLAAEVNVLNAKAQAGAGGDPGVPTADKMMALELEYAKLADKQAERETAFMIAQLNRDSKMMQVATEERISYTEVRADMEKFYAGQSSEADFKQRKLASDEFFKAAKLRLDEYQQALKQVNVQKGFDTFG